MLVLCSRIFLMIYLTCFEMGILSPESVGISFSSLRGTNHQVDLDFNSEKIHYNNEPPEYSIVFIEEDSIVVHTQAYPLEVAD